MINRKRYDRDMAKWNSKWEKLLKRSYDKDAIEKHLDRMPRLNDYRQGDPAPPGTHDMEEVR